MAPLRGGLDEARLVGERAPEIEEPPGGGTPLELVDALPATGADPVHHRWTSEDGRFHEGRAHGAEKELRLDIELPDDAVRRGAGLLPQIHSSGRLRHHVPEPRPRLNVAPVGKPHEVLPRLSELESLVQG